ncbi:MAG: hypothetical protein ABI690_13510 [Chloroflexota bacterium]
MTKPKLLKLRAAPAYLNFANPRIDRDNLVIRDTVAMQANVEALGHGIQSDQKTLEIMLGLSSRYSRGVKMHFGHTGMSENAMGRQIAWAKGFHIDGDRLIHDIHFMEQAAISPAFGQDPIEYILQMTESQPEDIGESVVIETEVVWTLPDGSEVDGYAERPENALTDLPVMRPVTLYYVDVVADPALTRGGLLASAMFAGSSSFFSDQAFKLIDEFRSEYSITLEELPRKVQLVLGRYMQARGYMPGADMNKITKPKKFDDSGAEEGVVPVTLDEPEAAETPAAEPAAPTQESANDVDDALQTAKSTESELADEPETEAEADEAETVPAEQYAAAMKLIAQLSTKVDQLTELATLNARNNAAMIARLQSLEGEPVVTERISGQRNFASPKLPDMTSLRKPTHVSSKVKASQAKQTMQAGSPALASLAASQARTGLE